MSEKEFHEKEEKEVLKHDEKVEQQDMLKNTFQRFGGNSGCH